MPSPFAVGRGHGVRVIESLLSVRVCMSVHPYVPSIRRNLISFENISVLDSYFIHRYIIIKYRSSSMLHLG